MKLRSDIQILRGLSVLFVVLYHLGFERFQAGFLGVDIFFVISGFLMAVLYDHRQKVSFLVRRAKRLLPAYFSVIIFTLCISFIINTPNETAQVLSQTKFATLFSSNIGFWLQNSYFSKTEFNPLLHLWSLGVEIQFYLIVPILAWFFSKSRVYLPLILFVSLALCFFVLGVSPKTSFFMMPLRLWEFLIGYGAAIFFTDHGRAKFSGFSWVGLVSLLLLMSIPLMQVDGKSSNIINGHPGLYSLMISLATGFILVFGLPRILEVSKVGTILITLGNYSYSIYLVHFPIIVLYLSSPFSGTILSPSSLVDTLIIVVLIFLLSAMQYRLIEQRFKGAKIKYLVFVPAITISLLTLTLPYLQLKNLSQKEQYVFNAFSDRSTYRCGKLIRVLEPGSISCELTRDVGNDNKRVMLVGNSHADSIKTTFAEVAKNENVQLYFLVPNNPLMDGGLSPETVVNEAVAKKVNTIVLHFSRSKINPELVHRLTILAKDVQINVVFIDPVPVWSVHIPKAMYYSYSTKNNSSLPVQVRGDYLSSNEELFNSMKKIQEENFERYSIVDYFCRTECVYSTPEGIPLYFDGGHLTLTGSQILADLFTIIVKKANYLKAAEKIEFPKLNQI